MTVYIVNKSAHDFSAAEKFGELVYITKGRLNRFAVNDMCRKTKQALEHSSPDDYIVPCSLNVLNAVACSVFARKHGRLNLLLFKDGDYLERNLILE